MDRLQEINEIESQLRSFFCIEDCDDSIEEVLKVLLELNIKHSERIEKLSKLRLLKLQRKAKSPTPKVSFAEPQGKNNFFIKQPTPNVVKYPKS